MLRKRSVISTENNDDLCLARSISMAWENTNVICADEWRDLRDELGSNLEKGLRIGKVSKSYYQTLLTKKRRTKRFSLSHMSFSTHSDGSSRQFK